MVEMEETKFAVITGVPTQYAVSKHKLPHAFEPGGRSSVALSSACPFLTARAGQSPAGSRAVRGFTNPRLARLFRISHRFRPSFIKLGYRIYALRQTFILSFDGTVSTAVFRRHGSHALGLE
jgi:hypothetical protein